MWRWGGVWPAGGVGSTGSAGAIGSDRGQVSAIRPNQEVGIYVSALPFSRVGERARGSGRQRAERPTTEALPEPFRACVYGRQFSLLKRNLLC